MHVLSLPQNKFGLVFFRLFDGALETSNFRFEEGRSIITLLRCFLHENTQRGKIARVKFAEELGTMSKNRLRWITLVRGPIWGIHSLTLMISCFVAFTCSPVSMAAELFHVFHITLNFKTYVLPVILTKVIAKKKIKTGLFCLLGLNVHCIRIYYSFV